MDGYNYCVLNMHSHYTVLTGMFCIQKDSGFYRVVVVIPLCEAYSVV